LLRWNRCKQERWQPVFFFLPRREQEKQKSIKKKKKGNWSTWDCTFI
jgi:hypothetical protein